MHAETPGKKKGSIMRILVLGGDGMLGHQLLKSLSVSHEVRATIRRNYEEYKHIDMFRPDNCYFGIDVCSSSALIETFSDFQPEAIINAVGIVKQRVFENEVRPFLEINALFPHQLSQLCKLLKARLVHISTDCVFRGDRGEYTDDATSDAIDVYGRTKSLGEVHASHAITLRTSIIGLELQRFRSLIEWFLAQKGTIKGYKRAIYTGLTTLELSRVIEKVLTQHSDLSGVWQVSSEKISKYDLLCTLNEKLERNDLQIEMDQDFFCDRSLDGSRFSEAIGYHVPSWDMMLSELAEQIKHR